MNREEQDAAALEKQLSSVALSEQYEPSTSSSESEYESTPLLASEEQRKLMRRIDLRLLIMLGILDALSDMADSNMGLAMASGMGETLKMTGESYNVANLVYFVPFILAQPMTPYLTQKLTPRVFISAIAVLWGIATMSMGFSNSPRTLTVLRVMLGLFPAGLIPAVTILLSSWYTRYEFGKRISIFSLCAGIIASFDGIVSHGLIRMDSLAKLEGWRWIFIIEGLVTVPVGFFSYAVLINFPNSSGNFLSYTEQTWINERMRKDCGVNTQARFNLRDFLKAGLDWRIWAYTYLLFCAGVIDFGLEYTLPLILRSSLGFSVQLSQILATPPYLVALIAIFINEYVGDRSRIRGPLILNLAVLSIVGVAVTGWARTPGVRYSGVFILTYGAHGLMPIIYTFQANNIRGHWRKSFSSMLLIAMSGMGGVAGSLVFRSQDQATGYKPGLYAFFAAAISIIVVSLILDGWFFSKNKQAGRDGTLLELMRFAIS